MALKMEVTDLNEVPDAFRGQYTKRGEKFVLELDGAPDHEGLIRKKDELLKETKAEREKRMDLERQLREREEADALKNKEFEKLADLHKKNGQEAADKLAALEKKVADAAKLAKAREVAGLLTKDASRASLIENEALKVIEYANDQAIITGGNTAAQLAETLKQKYPFLADGSPASGGGASGGGHSGGAVKKFSEYSGAELSEIRKQNPALYAQLKAAHENR